MNVLFVYPNITSQLHSPLGITSLSGVLKSARHKTMLFDTTWGYEREKLFRIIGEFKPKLVCFSVRNNDYSFALNIAKEIKQNHAIPIIFGGPQATLNPEKLISEDCIDFVCIGEGEDALKELVEKLEKNKPINRIKSIWAKKNGKVFRNEVRPLRQNLDELPFPDWEILDKRHLSGKLTFFLMGSRGCPYQCTYCANHAFQKIFAGKGNYIRYRNPKKVIEEIKEAKKSIKMDMVSFDDDTFTLNKKWLKEICELYKKEIKIPFNINGRANTIDEESLQILKDAGCQSIAIGIEEGNDIIRNQVLKRNMKKETIIKVFNDAKKLGIKTYAYNMVGLPFETEKTIFETIQLNRDCNVDGIQVSIFAPYEGTEIRELCEKNNWISEETLGNYYTHTTLKLPTISSASIDAFHKTFALYCYSPKILYPIIHVLRILFEKMPRKARDITGSPLLSFGRLIGVWKIHGFFETIRISLAFIKSEGKY